MSLNSNPQASEPQTAVDFLQQGWIAHVKGDLQEAEAAFRQALAHETGSVEARYALGVNLKIQGRTGEAAPEFNQVIELVKAGGMNDDPPRATMLRHLAGWHLHTLTASQGTEPRP